MTVRMLRPRRESHPSLSVLRPVLMLAAALAAPMTQAATPSSGSVSSTSSSITYSAGPFLVPNASATAGTLSCNALSPCDDFKLSVSVPAGYEADHTLSIKVSWSNTAADFDLYVLDATGAVLSTAASQSNPETVLLPARAGNYTLRAVPFLPLGSSLSATASLQALPPPPPVSQFPAAAYDTFTAPEALNRRDQAGEPSIGANWKTGVALYQSNLSTYRVSFNDTSQPATATWLEKSSSTAVVSLDPILFTDSVTGRTFESQLAGKASLMSYSDGDGESWLPSMGSGINSGVDHQTVGGGPFSKNGPLGVLGPLTSYPHAVYYCSQDIADASCALSRDGGLTFGVAVPMYSLLQCGGLHGHVKVAPDGTVYVPNKGCNGQQGVAVSTDNGLTWSVRTVPGSLAGESDPSVGIGADGTVYFGYQNANGHPRVAVSRDQGLTWSDDQDVGYALGIQNVVFPAVVAGDADRAAFAFIGTPSGGNYQDAANFQGAWHLYVAHTYDGGKTWKTTDTTPNDPVQRGSICTGGTTCGNDRNLLDFMDITVDREGRVLVGYADGCVGACVQGGANSFSQVATIARQSGGERLFRTPRPVP